MGHTTPQDGSGMGQYFEKDTASEQRITYKVLEDLCVSLKYIILQICNF